MKCPYCLFHATVRLAASTSLGYPTYCCSGCSHKFNERTGTPYNHLQFPTDVMLLVVLWRLRYIQGSSMRARRDLAEMFLERGFEFNKEGLCDQCSKGLGSSLCAADYRAVTG